MALTPEDVVNKRFQPTKFREGYDQDEVDDFLDEVVVELRRLNQENEELRQRLVAGESRISELQRSAAQPAALTEAPEPQAFAPQGQIGEQVQPRFGETPVAAPVPAVVPAPIAYPSPDQNAIDSGSTNNLLQLARKLHEEHVREGIEKRDALIAEGHATAARVVSEAEAAQRSQISALDNEKAALEQQKTTIERQIEELRTFEREYRQKLKGYIEGQLRELDATEPAPASAAFESVPATSGSYDLGSSEPVQTPPPASFQGFGGN
ncbi:MAG: DivIVA domain-containing protein [Actinomycetota bacterium]